MLKTIIGHINVFPACSREDILDQCIPKKGAEPKLCVFCVLLHPEYQELHVVASVHAYDAAVHCKMYIVY